MIDANTYPKEVLDDYDDDGTMPDNVEQLSEKVVGHKILKVEQGPAKSDDGYSWRDSQTALLITLDNGTVVELLDTDDCCAFTELKSFIAHPENFDHVITGVGTTEGYETWHIYASVGDVVELKAGWSAGNPFYYGYGFHIQVKEISK